MASRATGSSASLSHKKSVNTRTASDQCGSQQLSGPESVDRTIIASDELDVVPGRGTFHNPTEQSDAFLAGVFLLAGQGRS